MYINTKELFFESSGDGSGALGAESVELGSACDRCKFSQPTASNECRTRKRTPDLQFSIFTFHFALCLRGTSLDVFMYWQADIYQVM